MFYILLCFYLWIYGTLNKIYHIIYLHAPCMLPWSVLGQVYLFFYFFWYIKDVIVLIMETHIVRINVGLYHKQDWRQVKDYSWNLPMVTGWSNLHMLPMPCKYIYLIIYYHIPHMLSVIEFWTNSKQIIGLHNNKFIITTQKWLIFLREMKYTCKAGEVLPTH